MINRNYILICARQGSKGIKNKNLQKVGKISLVEHSIKLAKKIKDNFIIISTDSKKILKLGKKNKVDFLINRPKSLSGDKSPEINVWKHAVKITDKKLKLKMKYLIILPPTSPLRNIQDILKCITKFKTKKFDLVIMGYKTNHNPYFNMVKKNGNYFNIVNSSKKNFFRRQDAPEIFNISTACYIIKVNYLLKKKNIYSDKIGLVEIPTARSIDIDTKLDLKIANFMYKKKSN